MAGTVGQYNQGAFSTPVNGTLADASVVLSNDNAVRTKHNSHDNDATIHVQSSTLASRPAAGTAQRVWFTTDGLRGYIDSGVAWQELAYLTSTAPTTITSTTAPQFTIAYDGSNNVAFSVSSAGAVTINATGASAGFTFSDAATFSSTATLSGALTYGGVTLSNAVTGTGSMVLSASPTLTGTALVAALTASGLITGSAGVTVASGQNLTLTGATVVGTPTWGSSQAITLSTVAQPNVTSVGTLTSLGTIGAITTTMAFDNTLQTWTSTGTAVTLRMYLGNNSDAGAHFFTVTNHQIGFATNNSAKQAWLATTGIWHVPAGITVSTGTTAVQALTATTVTATTSFSVSVNTNAAASGLLAVRNENAGNAAFAGIQIGNNTSASAGTIRMFSSTFTGNSEVLQIMAQSSASKLQLGSDGDVGMTMNADQSVIFAAGITATTGLFAVAGSAGAGVSVTGSSSPQMKVTSTGTTVTANLQADDASGYVGTSTNHPLIIRSNNTTAITVATNQAVTFAAGITATAFKTSSGTTTVNTGAGAINLFTIPDQACLLIVHGSNTGGEVVVNSHMFYSPAGYVGTVAMWVTAGFALGVGGTENRTITATNTTGTNRDLNWTYYIQA